MNATAPQGLQLARQVEQILVTVGADPAALAGGGALVVHSPIDGSVIGRLAETTTEQAQALIAAAHAAFGTWRLVPAPRRGELVRLLGDELRRAKSDLAQLVTIETGKILSEGLGEVQEMIDICDFAVGLSRQLHGLTLATERPAHRMMETWHPLGVCGVISAFNFPVAVWSWNAALALVCGDPVLWKPSEKTPLCALAVHALLQRAVRRFDAETQTQGPHGRVPPGLASVLIGGRALGECLVDDPRVALLSATGSTAMSARASRHVLAAACSSSAATTPASSAHRPTSTSHCARSRSRRWVPPGSAAPRCAGCSFTMRSTTRCCRGCSAPTAR